MKLVAINLKLAAQIQINRDLLAGTELKFTDLFIY